jgi:DNA repair photolyase
MAAAKPLFEIDQAETSLPRLQVHLPRESPAGLPRIRRIRRQGPVLHDSPWGAAGEILALNLAMGCAQRCAFCSARAYPRYPGDEVLQLYLSTSEDLYAELAAKRHKPRAVLICPSTDPFPPLAEVQNETKAVVEVLADLGVEGWLMTRGYIRPSVSSVLAAHRDRVRVTVGITSLERRTQRMLEPLTAPPRLRIRQIAELRAKGVPLQVALEPLIPSITDTRANLLPLLEAVANVGVNHVTTSYMFLRSGIRANLLRALESQGLDEPVLRAFEGGPLLKSGPLAPAQYLPKDRRQRGYAALMALAAGMGVTVSVSALTNPDFHAVSKHTIKPLGTEAISLF